MEHWHQSSIPPSKAEDEQLSGSSRVLTRTSGNVQAYGLDTRQGIENKDPLISAAVERADFKSAPSPYSIEAFASNNHNGNLLHLNARRQRHGHTHRENHRLQEDPPRPYLLSEAYKKYKERPRQDVGKDGAPVWDPVNEEAFQEALIRIIPMGRKKRTQNGKPYGRNELISEYIYHRIGSRRNRKQISSHIQVLNGKLNHIPEWNAVIKASEDENNPNDHRYYDTSIRDMIRGKGHGYQHVHHLYPSRNHANGLPPPASTLRSNADHMDMHCVAKLNFVMWVSPPNPAPNQMTDQLHRYTEIQCCDSSSQPAPLESAKNWRTSFPHLASLMEHTSLSQCCDVILLEATFRLMPDFPPPSCKLGINLELDFRHPMANMEALTDLHDWKWICVTRMYEHGKCFQQTKHHCDLKKQKMEIGKVAPSFESKYWAEKFVNLIEKKRGAEESGNEGAISAANEKSRNFFGGLSAMQELVAYAPHELPLLETQSKPPQGKRMAILLWKFSQAQPGHVGITTWQRLIPPPHRDAMNSPAPTEDAALPPLIMDAMVEDMDVDRGISIPKESHSQLDGHVPYQVYDTNLGDENSLMMHHGYDLDFNHDELSAFAGMHSPYGMPASCQDISQSSFSDLDFFAFDYQQHEASLGHHDSQRPGTANFSETQRVHDPSNQVQSNSGLLMAAPPYGLSEQSLRDSGEEQEAQRQPLNAFDRNTHNVLQAQLEQDRALDHDAEDKALQEVMAAASTMTDLEAQGHPHLSPSPQQQQQRYFEQDRSWEKSFMSRPPLPRYSSYASQHVDDLHAIQHLPVTPRNEAFETNELASALQSHNSALDAMIYSLEHRAKNQSVCIPHNGDPSLETESTVTLASENTVKLKGVNDGNEHEV